MEREKNILKRFWLLIVISISIVLILVFLIQHGNQKQINGATSGSGTESGSQNNQPITGNDRIVATFTPESGSAFQYNPPTIVDDFIYIGTSTKIDPSETSSKYLTTLPLNYFYKFDLDLKPVWTYSLGATMVDGGASLDSQGNIYFVTIDYAPIDNSANVQKGGGKNFLTLLNLYSLTNDGQFRWKRQISARNETWLHAMINCAIDANDTIYVGDSKLFAFDTDGNIKWQFPADSREIVGFRSSPIIDENGNVYFVSPEATKGGYETDQVYIYKFSPTSGGNPVWATLLDNQILDPEGGASYGGGMRERWVLSSPAFSSNQMSLIAIVGNTVNRVDTGNGTILWSMKPEGATGSFKASPAVDENDNIYVGTKSNKESIFYAIRADGSGLIWTITIGSDMYASPFLGDDGNVYFGSETSEYGHFHVADMKTGQLLWNIGNEIPDLSFGSPILYKGFLYVGVFQKQMFGNTLFKVRADAFDYLPNAAWPRFHGGNSNNGRQKGGEIPTESSQQEQPGTSLPGQSLRTSFSISKTFCA